MYDLYKLFPKVKVNGSLSELIKEVRDVRKKSKMCVSAQDDCSVNEILRKIIEQDFYKKDYEEITKDLLFEDVDYKTVLNNLQQIERLDIF